MSTSNFLTHILKTNYLIGVNYKDWLKNLKIVLTSEKLGHVLDQKSIVLSNHPTVEKELLLISRRMKIVRSSAIF